MLNTERDSDTAEDQATQAFLAAIYAKDSAEVAAVLSSTELTELDGDAIYWAAQEAVESGNSRVLEQLLDAGVDPDNPGDQVEHTVPLIAFAVPYGNPEMIRMLIDAGADVTYTTPDGRTLLISAAETNEPSVIELLLDAKLPVRAQDESGLTALHVAAKRGSPEIVRLFIEAGADIYAEHEKYRPKTPMDQAIFSANVAIVRMLLEAGYSPNYVASDGHVPLNSVLVCKINHRPMNHDTGEELSIDEFAQRLVDIAEMLFDVGAQLPANQFGSNSLLHSAAVAHSAEMIALLINEGADPNKTSSFGMTPLHEATMHGYSTITTSTPGGMEAEEHIYRLEAIVALLENGADVNKPDYHGWTPLHYAVVQSPPAVIEALLAAGADVSATDDKGWTPLHVLGNMTLEESEIAQILIAAGADPAATDNNGDTPAELSAKAAAEYAANQ